MSALLTETNTPEVEAAVLAAAELALRNGLCGGFGADFEHGQWWVTCLECGRQWSVVDCDPGDFDFEEVSEGDGYCNDTED
jgi:hypothetical protein